MQLPEAASQQLRLSWSCVCEFLKISVIFIPWSNCKLVPFWQFGHCTTHQIQVRGLSGMQINSLLILLHCPPCNSQNPLPLLQVPGCYRWWGLEMACSTSNAREFGEALTAVSFGQSVNLLQNPRFNLTWRFCNLRLRLRVTQIAVLLFFHVCFKKDLWKLCEVCMWCIDDAPMFHRSLKQTKPRQFQNNHLWSTSGLTVVATLGSCHIDPTICSRSTANQRCATIGRHRPW